MASTLLWSRRSFLKLAASGTAAALALGKVPPILASDDVSIAMSAELIDIMAEAPNTVGEFAIGRVGGAQDILRLGIHPGGVMRWVAAPGEGIVVHTGLENRSTFDIRVMSLIFSTLQGVYSWTPAHGMVPLRMTAPVLELEPWVSGVT